MRVSVLAAALAATPILAYPGMKSTLSEIRSRADKDGNGADDGDSNELIGDLVTLDDSKFTTVGKSVKQLLTGSGTPESDEIYSISARGGNLAAKDSQACAADTCCIWKYIANDLQGVFKGASGRCTDLARAAVRLGFHDAGGWSKNTGPLGGADGSIILAPEEMTRGENRGLEEIVAQTKVWYNQYKKYGIGMADLVQFSANVATVVCPLGPRIRTYIGRKDSAAPCPNDLLPPVTGSADFLIQLFENKTIKAHGLTALIGAHTTSQQRFVDPNRAGDPQDSTPGVWDVKFYKETLGSAPARVFKFASDVVLAKDPRISAEFQAFAGPGGQSHWNEDYAREYIRLSLLGVDNINDLTECTKALPARTGSSFTAPDQAALDKWLATTDRVAKIADALRNGGNISSLINTVMGWLKGIFNFRW
ncbi:peroxidase [Colletotrichum graminicola M1.001]|uniref:Peroxidase n=1 Tax=Colletotrichum graminicola (strain M1.001 / M2 / FGSC 10212) TaxID=645133 RepID=E3QU26_COLGM|nr:peroxidase [Colletotrichum graminicola M1.001]EFQ34364.1 peroxidase [Colletotrichum graminicola M1.001]